MRHMQMLNRRAPKGFICAVAAVMCAGAAASAQNGGHPQTQPWGHTHSSAHEPYKPVSRDSQGNRLIINGRVVDMGDSASPGSYNSSVSRPGYSTLSQGGTLRRGPSLNAVAIGNSIELTGISNSTLILNQYNYGQQIASVPGNRSTSSAVNSNSGSSAN
jgi:hypothetical protein